MGWQGPSKSIAKLEKPQIKSTTDQHSRNQLSGIHRKGISCDW
ncbi:MAG: hypothetical protein ACI9O6_002518 [Glaciecola sp.]|jgi:hypothetical protein